MRYHSKNDCKQIIINIFKNRPGRRNALRIDELQKLTGINNRELRASISELRKQGILILSSCAKRPYGYYLAETPEEVREGVADLISRARDLSETIRGIQKGAESSFNCHLQIEDNNFLFQEVGSDGQ